MVRKIASKSSMVRAVRSGFVCAALLLAGCTEQPVSAQRVEVTNSQLEDGQMPVVQDVSNAELMQQHERLGEELETLRTAMRDTRASGTITWLAGLLGLGLGIALMALLGALRRRRGSKQGRTRSEAHSEPERDHALEDLRQSQKIEFDRISRELVDIGMKVTRLDKAALPAAAGTGAIRQPVETHRSMAEPAGAGTENMYAPVDTRRPDPKAQSAPTGASGQADRIAESFNAINSASTLADFEQLHSPQPFSNMRDQGTDQIFENDIARFWLIRDSSDDNRGYLMPGSDAIRNWVKYRKETVDNPFGYHFDLTQGEELRVQRPARVVKSAEGWKLEAKGMLSGMQ